jgi:arylsulfatase A-like enzyme
VVAVARVVDQRSARTWLVGTAVLASLCAIPSRTALYAQTEDRAADKPIARTVARSGAKTIVWRALDRLASANVDAPRLVPSYRALLRSGTLFNRNPHARHAPPRDRLDLLVTRLADAGKRSFDLRAALYAPPPAKISFQVEIPEGGALRLAVARSGGPATARVRVDDETVFEVRPFLRWTERELSLARFAGKTVRLSFESEGRGHVFFGDPSILAPRAVRGPNVLVVLVDTLAAWAVGCYGLAPSVTPHIDRLCAQGVRFDHAIASANWTRPSVTSMLTSWWAGRVGISYNQFFGLDIAPERTQFYARAPDLLPAMLTRAGYETGAIVNNLFLQGYHRYGVDLGFAQVVDYRRHVEDTVDITDETLRFLEKNRHNRFFAFLNYNAPHVHYAPPAGYAREARRLHPRAGPKTAAYLGEVRYTDAEVGRLLDGLDRLGLTNDTLVILTADHGEVHDARHAYRVVRTGRHSRFGHAVTMYDEEVRVPLVLRWPGKLPEGKRVAAQVRHLDFAPTVLDAAGIPASPKHQGKSYLALARGEREQGERAAFVEGRMMRAVRAEGHKFFWRLPGYERIARGGRVVHVAEELYDLAADPKEHRNLAADVAQRERLVRLRALAKQFVEREAMPEPSPSSAQAPPAAASTQATARSDASQKRSAASPTRSRVHLLFVGNGEPHTFEGRVRVPGGATHFRLRHQEAMDAVWREDDGTIRFRLTVARDRDALWIEPARQGAIDVEMKMDAGGPLPLRVGPFGLPLLDAGRIDAAHLSFLDASSAPPVRPGRELGAFLWREGGAVVGGDTEASQAPARDADVPAAESEEAGREGAGGAEVEGMLRDWGYIQGRSPKADDRRK